MPASAVKAVHEMPCDLLGLVKTKLIDFRGMHASISTDPRSSPPMWLVLMLPVGRETATLIEL
jgi:hypothetical protein